METDGRREAPVLLSGTAMQPLRGCHANLGGDPRLLPELRSWMANQVVMINVIADYQPLSLASALRSSASCTTAEDAPSLAAGGAVIRLIASPISRSSVAGAYATHVGGHN